MGRIQQIHNLELFKILGNPRRINILRRLMTRAETLSSLGKLLGEHPARVRHHLKLLEQAGLIEMVEARQKRGVIEKYYRAKASAFHYQGIILPGGQIEKNEPLVILGSHDLAIELLEEESQPEPGRPRVLSLPTGSLDGLIALRQGQGHLAGCHIYDEYSGEYNLPQVRLLFPDRRVRVFTLAHREQGWIVAPQNPLQISTVEDLQREDIRLVNRNPGSGTRIWLDQQLRKAGLQPEQTRGYTCEVNTHTAVARAVLEGSADVGLGLRAAADQLGLDFIPLFHERFDLVIPEDFMHNPMIQVLLNHLQSQQFRQAVAEMPGYDTSHTGEELVV
jgi:putative molybdopterin biosynthesis protein